MLTEYIDLKTLYTIIHLFGVVIGAGSAFMSDAMYIHATRDRVINTHEFHFLKLGSRMVWIGIFIIVVSGILLFSLNPAGYLASSKFLVKMAIVAVIIVNGFFFHFAHTPVLGRTVGDMLHVSEEFRKKSRYIYIGGAISIVSWSAAIVLGSLRGIPYTFWQGIGIYATILVIAIFVAELSRRHFLKKN